LENREKEAQAAKDGEDLRKQITELQKQQQNMIEFFNTNMEVMVRNTIAQELDGTTKKENQGIKRLIQGGNFAAHWGAAREEAPSGS
jgi:ribosomal protein S6E (S10)